MPSTLAAQPVGGTAHRQATRLRRREILDAALKCFLKNGVRDTTMEQIRTAANASNGSVYHLFQSKDRIAYELYVEGMRDYHDRVLAAVAGKRTARGVIRAIIATHLKITVEGPELSLYLCQMGMANEVQDVAAEFREANDHYAREIFACLKPYMDAGELVSLPPDPCFSLIIGPAAHLARSWLRGRYSADPLAATEVLAEAAWKSLCVPGRKD